MRAITTSMTLLIATLLATSPALAGSLDFGRIRVEPGAFARMREAKQPVEIARTSTRQRGSVRVLCHGRNPRCRVLTARGAGVVVRSTRLVRGKHGIILHLDVSSQDERGSMRLFEPRA